MAGSNSHIIILTNKENQKYTNSNLKSETIDSIEFGIKDVIDNSFITASIFFSQTNNEIATLDRNANNPALKEWNQLLSVLLVEFSCETV